MEAAHVEVVDDLLDEVADVLDERRVGLDVARRSRGRRAPPGRSRASWRSSPRRSRRARGRGGRAAARPRRAAPSASSRTTSSRASGGAPASARSSPCSADDEPLAHALAQLARGHPGEGHEQEPVERRALGHVARGERRDGVRLAGAGARLEHRDAGRAAARRRRTAAAPVPPLIASVTSSQREQAVPQPAGVAAEARGLGGLPAVARLVGARRARRAARRTSARRRARAGARAPCPPCRTFQSDVPRRAAGRDGVARRPRPPPRRRRSVRQSSGSGSRIPRS